MKIMIATPAYGGEVTTTYCDALIWLLDHFREKHPQIRFRRRFLSLSVLPFMRNLYASLVLQDESFTHLLFVDADMGFAPSLIERMIAAGKPVVGSMAPLRKLDLARYYSLKDEIADPKVAQVVAMDYANAGAIDFKGAAGKPGESRSFDDLIVDGSCIRVRKTGASVLLIHRSVFARLKERYPELWCTQIADTYAQFGLTKGTAVFRTDAERTRPLWRRGCRFLPALGRGLRGRNLVGHYRDHRPCRNREICRQFPDQTATRANLDLAGRARLSPAAIPAKRPAFPKILTPLDAPAHPWRSFRLARRSSCPVRGLRAKGRNLARAADARQGRRQPPPGSCDRRGAVNCGRGAARRRCRLLQPLATADPIFPPHHRHRLAEGTIPHPCRANRAGS